LKLIVNGMRGDSKEDVSDFEGCSSSDASVHSESSDDDDDETEGSSGVQSSDVETVDEDGDENFTDSPNNSYRKGKQSIADSEEIKTARKLVSSYAESFHGLKISTKTIKWTREL
jgi:hypothetical protein